MISAIVYFISSIVLTIFCYKVYFAGHGKNKTRNPFVNNFSWATFFIAISFLKGAVLIMIAISFSITGLLFWTDFIGRALFYTAAIFSVQIPLYKFFPKNKKAIIVPYISGLIGVLLLIYQFYFRNTPTISSEGIVSWNANIILGVGMTILFIVPWAVTSFIFIKEFINSKIKSPKPLLLGIGFFLICIGGILQDLSTIIFTYIAFSMILMAGFLTVLTGMFYEEE